MKNRNADAERIERCFKTLNGTVASSPIVHCMKPNKINNTPKPTNNPTMVAEFQGCACPPHCRARSKQTTEARSMRAPSGSSCMIRALSVIGVRLFSILRKIMIKTKVTKPIGRFLYKRINKWVTNSSTQQITYIQKHHLQLTFCVNAPPMMGPTQILIPNTLITADR